VMRNDSVVAAESKRAVTFYVNGVARFTFFRREEVLADIDAYHGDRSIGCLRHGVLLVFGAPCQLRLLAGQEHGRTIPLADLKPW